MDDINYAISDSRKKLWECELKMISWLDEVCNKHNIQYFLIGGTEIGAVRHKGFIPWDDDMDIGMLRRDFDVFMSVYMDYLPDNFDVQYRLVGNETVWSNLCRIRDKNTTGIIDNQIGKNIVHGAFIEIYPYDNVPDSRDSQIKLAKKLEKLILVLQDKIGQKHIRSLRMKLFKLLYLSKSAKELDAMIDSYCRQYNNCKTTYVSTMMSPQYLKSGSEVLERSAIEQTIYVPFEDIKLRIPKGYDQCLTKQYGDYMKLPPVDQRGEHHSTKVFYDPSRPYNVYREKSMSELFAKYGFML